MSRLAELLIESSVLARLAEGAQVDLGTARRCLKKLSLFSDAELRFARRIAGLGDRDMAALLDAVADPIPPLALVRKP